MGVDSFDKILVQQFKEANLDMLSFTPQMEAKIWEGIRQKKQKTRRVFASLSLACGFALIVLGSRSVWLGDTQLTSKEPIIKNETDFKALSPAAKKTVQSLYKFAPYLQNGKVTKVNDESEKSKYYIEIKDKEKEEGWSAEIRIDRASGALENLDVWGKGRSWETESTESMTVEKATAVLQEMLGEKSKEYKKIESSKGTASFNRYVNEIPLRGDYIGIEINERGELNGYWREGYLDFFVEKTAFPHPSEAVPLHEIENQLQKYIKLRYVEHFDPKNDRPILEYTPGILNAVNFDGKTGKPIYLTYYDYDPSISVQMNPPNKPVTVRNQQEAELLIKQEYGIKGTLKVYSADNDDDDHRKEENETVYQFGAKGQFRVITESSTGRVIGITKDAPNAKGKISKEQAQERAFRFLEKYLDPWDKEVQLTYSRVNDEDSKKNAGDYKFRFFKSHQGIPVLPTVDSYVSYLVEIDSATGEGISFSKGSIKEPYSNNQQVTLPDRNAIISPEVGAREWLRYHPLELGYEIKSGEKTPRLVYELAEDKLNKDVFIDATTGKVIFVDR